MVEDVRLAVEGRCDVSFYGRPGGSVATPEEIARVLSSSYHRIGGESYRQGRMRSGSDLKRKAVG